MIADVVRWHHKTLVPTVNWGEEVINKEHFGDPGGNAVLNSSNVLHITHSILLGVGSKMGMVGAPKRGDSGGHQGRFDRNPVVTKSRP